MTTKNRGDGLILEDGGQLDVINAVNYAVCTTGTTTVKAVSGIYFGAYSPVLGTTPTVAVNDGTTALVATSTPTLNVLLNPFLQGVGIRFATSLVVVVTGTATVVNVLWD